MAIINYNGRISGVVGKISYRTLGNQTIMQSVPGKGNVKQAANQKRSATDFGRASNRAKIIRDILWPVIRGLYDSSMINRLNAALVAIIHGNTLLPGGSRNLEGASLELLNNFEFNTDLPFSKAFKAKMTCTITPNQFAVQVESFNAQEMVIFPSPAISCNLNLLYTAIDFTTGTYRYLGHATYPILEDSVVVPPLNFVFQEDVPQGSLLIATASLDYFGQTVLQKISVNDKHLNPAKILAVYSSEGSDVQLPEETFMTGWFPIPDQIL